MNGGKQVSVSVQLVAPLVPYVAVAVGLLFLRSAWVAMLGYHAGMGLVITLEHRWHLAHDLFKGMDRRLLTPAVFVCAVSGLVLYALWPWVDSGSKLNIVLSGFGLTGWGWTLFIVYFCLVNPWLEELFWRGYLGRATYLPISTDFWFAGYHLLVFAGLVAPHWAVIALIALTIAAWGWRQLAHIGRGLMMPALTHLAADASIILSVYALSLR